MFDSKSVLTFKYWAPTPNKKMIYVLLCAVHMTHLIS